MQTSFLHHVGTAITTHFRCGLTSTYGRQWKLLIAYKSLKCAFQSFTRTMHAENPLRSLTHLQSLHNPSSTIQRHVFYSLIRLSPIYQTYRVELQKVLPWISYTFSDFILEERIAFFRKDPLVLLQVILPTACNRTLVDINLRLRSAKFRSLALRWRKNRLTAQLPLPLWLQTYKRSYIFLLWPP
jgi:hypothetical protein